MRRDGLRVEAFDRARHDVRDFASGNPALDRWLQAYAGQSQRRDVARTFVAVNTSGNVVGYDTLVAGQVEHADAADTVRARLSAHFPIPVGLIARLAVTAAYQRQGLGTDLLRDALRRLLAAAEQVGMRAALVHAVDSSPAAFYERLGFEPATPDGLTLMVPLAAVREALLGDD